MANRPVFYVNKKNKIETIYCNFRWFPGFSYIQKNKSINSLSSAFRNKKNIDSLEVSSSSSSETGINASAFNLVLDTKQGFYTVEQLFQAGKDFYRNGEQSYILNNNSIDDIYNKRLKNKLSKNAKYSVKILNNNDYIIGFKLFNKKFPNYPRDFYYNWIYCCALNQNVNNQIELSKQIVKYDAFTDINFNPQKSINCQAKACAIFTSLYRSNFLFKALQNPKSFLKLVYDI
ncbi:DarT1-associated NADAR antitoxin family protein [Apilactobacillus timberlakei]|uniref:Uncharacterized protein n=1 Tax=Apilactobacillus timberlakei TaxID=2008380 RepID=A0ABY2YS79_9LACO|nr:hypothetical protein [Apilactobacillus timberlakei]TPR13083.1 hypothetical protein DYZ97_04140 [Apilactobacillus timberlakei]TPR14134.1 hypothetical protein DY048_04095 [Apilactobacillus timberlakei]TPR16388.1 hypothetical protein DY052_02190 [Apilactobacillus timberlakei]